MALSLNRSERNRQGFRCCMTLACVWGLGVGILVWYDLSALCLLPCALEFIGAALGYLVDRPRIGHIIGRMIAYPAVFNIAAYPLHPPFGVALALTVLGACFGFIFLFLQFKCADYGQRLVLAREKEYLDSRMPRCPSRFGSVPPADSRIK
jgi:hypothetical protein